MFGPYANEWASEKGFSMEKPRRQVTPQQKVAILPEHLVQHLPVLDLCYKHKYYQWRNRYRSTNRRRSFPGVITGSSNGKGMRSSTSSIASRWRGYRRLTFMMLDRDIVAVSRSSTYRVLKGAGLLGCWKPKPSLKAPALCSRSPSGALARRCPRIDAGVEHSQIIQQNYERNNRLQVSHGRGIQRHQ
jgi:hypothetical protein